MSTEVTPETETGTGHNYKLAEATRPTEIVVRELPTINAAAVTATMEALKTIRQFVASELVEGIDYGTIPGTGTKKVMLLPGAQKVNMLYNCYPRYTVSVREVDSLGHAEFQVITELVNRSTDSVVGSGVGSCSTMESKYRYRQANRKCPSCGKEAIIKGREEYGGGWVCFKKKDGCGAKFSDDAPAVVSQPVGRLDNADIYDVRNTVLKMAKKRSLVDASIGLGCLTELFTQDLEENGELAEKPVDRTPVSPEQVAEIRKVVKERGRSDEEVLKLFKVEDYDQLLRSEFGHALWAIRHLSKKGGGQ